MEKILLAVAVALAVILLIRFESWRKNRKIAAAFEGRTALSAEAFHERFFRGQGVPLAVVTGVRQVLEDHLGADLSGLQADDDFSRNLGFFWDFDSLANVEIVCALEKQFGIAILDEEAAAAVTVSDLVHLVKRKVQLAVDAATATVENEP